MLEETTAPEYAPLPLRYLLSTPATFDEALARSTVASGRLIAQAWGYQRLLEGCAVRMQACLFGTAEQLWRHSLEACYLSEPRRTEKIPVS
jgi:hypothetical protein